MNRLSKSNKFDENLHNHLPEQKSYNATTCDISVTVWPEFIDNKAGLNGDIYVWSYQVLVENKREEAVQIIKRSWKIVDEKGTVQEISGEGVVGEQPTIAAGASYQYSSGVHLRCPSGIMTGTYKMQKNNLEIFEVKIPTFSLDVPSVKSVIN